MKRRPGIAGLQTAAAARVSFSTRYHIILLYVSQFIHFFLLVFPSACSPSYYCF
jgi:hypothetical protein